jgi:murein L,D-transpeptidase YafK
MKLHTIIFSVFLFVSHTVLAVQKEMIWLAVDKNNLKAELRTLPELQSQSKVLATFRIAVGKEKGDKERRGDNRTPEGIYFALNHIQEDDLLISKYGKTAIPLNFPNPVDKMDHKTGYGIWLHGAGNDDRIASENVTEGCVAFYNADILKLKSWLRPYQGIVTIAQDLQQVNNPQDVSTVMQLTSNWIESWRARNIDKYISYYGDQFSESGRSKAAYRAYKKQVFKSYKSMKVEMSTIRVLTHPKYALSIMNQDFQGDRRFSSRGRKMIYWKKEDGQWRIIKEEFSPVPLSTYEYTMDEVKKLNHSQIVVN